MILRLAFVLLISLFPAASLAEPVVYLCDTQTNRQNGAIQDQIVFAYDENAATVLVNDIMIVGLTGGPIAGNVASDNSTRVVFSWTLRNVPSTSGQIATLAFRATLFKASGKIDITMRPLNYTNTFSATGTCRPT